MTRIALLAMVSGCNGILGVHGFPATDAQPIAVDVEDDAPVRPAGVIEAEDFTSNTSTQYAWQVATATAGFSGTGYMQSGPGNGSICSDFNHVATCAPHLSYALDVPAAGTYYVHLRMLAADATVDTVWWGIDGAVVQELAVTPTDGTWQWVASAPTQLVAAPHRTVDLWMRESGSRVDVVGLTTSPTPAP